MRSSQVHSTETEFKIHVELEFNVEFFLEVGLEILRDAIFIKEFFSKNTFPLCK
jgi:hypothetical protein